MVRLRRVVAEGRRTGLLFVGAPSVPEMVKLAQRAEERGFDSIWVAETRMTRDGFVPLAAIAAATKRARVGTGIVNVYTRNPVVLAISFVALEELAPGRVQMGLGAGSPLVLAPQGIPFERPLTRLREYCDVVPRLIRGEELRYQGEAVHLAGARLEDVLSKQDEIGGARTRLPLWLGVTGPKALEYAGSVADGVMMNVCLSTDYVRDALNLIERGAQRSGRRLEDIEIAIGLATSPNETSEEGKRGAARFIALYLSMFPNIARVSGVPEATITATRQALNEQGLDAAAAHIGDDLVDRLAVGGTPEQCRARLDEYRAVGVQMPIVAPLEGTIELAIDSLA
jgi:5,10-methylenetetrahydromethanopterin reductase